MRFRTAVAITAFSAASALAQSPNDAACQHSVKKPIAFASAKAHDHLTVRIGPGPCHAAELSITVTSAAGRVLYRYVAPFKKHVVEQWNDPDLIEVARAFVGDTASQAIVATSELPTPKVRGQTVDGESALTVPASVFKRIVSAHQPALYHSTYHDGGQYVAFDPAVRRVRVIAQWGV